MYETLTALIPALSKNNYGDKENVGTRENPKQLPFVNYGEAVSKLKQEIYRFENENPHMNLQGYGDILKASGIEWSTESMKQADVSKLDGKTVIALLLGAADMNDFLNDEKLKRAVAMTVINIGELVKNITDETRLAYKNVPWKAIAGMRDIAAHKYQTLRMEDVYNTVKMDFSSLRKQLEQILKEAEK